MIKLLLFVIMNLLQFLCSCRIHSNIINFYTEISKILIDTVQFNPLSLFYQLRQSREGPLDRFNTHVIVHLLSHEGRFSVSFSLLTDGQGIKLGDIPQVIENIGLVVA